MLRGLGDEAGAQALTGLATRIGDAAREFEAGTIRGEAYAEKLKDVVTEAQDTLTAMGELDQARLSGATTTHAVRAAIQRSQVEGPPAIGSRAGLRARGAEQGVRDQPQDGREVAQAGDGRGPEDWAEGTALIRADRGRRGDGGGVPAAHALASGRLPLCPAADHPAPDALVAAPLSSAP